AGVWPRRTDNVVIRNTHTITINAVDDNKSCGNSPNGLNRSNVSTFTGSADLMFYHTGDILISNGGTLVSSQEIMIEGYTHVENGGALNVNEDIINLGYFEVSASTTFSNTDDLILSGNSITIINNTSTGFDDIYIDHTNATLCGTGVMNIGNGSPDPTIQYFNGASLNQICSSFTVTCSMNCPGGFPMAGTGNFSTGNTGPGGVGNAGNNQLWLRGNSSVFVDGGTTLATNNQQVQQWNDQSGNSRNATELTNKPTLINNVVNGFPSLRFDNNDRLLSAGVTTGNSASVFVVAQYSSLPSSNPGLIQGAPSGLGFSTAGSDKCIGMWVSSGGNPWGRGVQSNNAAVNISQVTNMPIGTFRTILNLYNAGASLISQYIDNSVSGSVGYNGTLKSWTDFGIGRQGTESWSGDIAEVIAYNTALNAVQRIIISNYLSAKYLTSLGVPDNVYTMDEPGNGNYDYEVAGIGQASDGSNHRDARGSGVVRMWNPNALGNSEFLMWGHDGTALASSTTATPADVDGTVIEERLSRIWRVSETGGDVGTVSISFNFSGVGGSPIGSNLRLLIDRDGDGFGDNDVTPAVGSVSNGIATFSNINFQNGDRFTLGNTDVSSPLPIELIEFTAESLGERVLLGWVTASELNNDFFTVERSKNAEEWQEVSKLAGAGTSQKTNKYSLLDYQPLSGASYYRVKQTDYDGSFSYSEIRLVKLSETYQFRVFPNPSQGLFSIEGLSEGGTYDARVFNSIGQLVNASIEKTGNNLVADLSSFPDGIYFIQVAKGTMLQSLRLIKRK
ncbi:MAG: T9SS type A sorting domain-containing protein, partial [Cyclobacteriaceae bacterium]